MIYVVLAEHQARECPTASSETRELMLKGTPELPNVAARLGVKILAGPYVNWEHVTVLVAEAGTAEAMVKFVSETGLQQWNRVRLIPSWHLDEGIEAIRAATPIF